MMPCQFFSHATLLAFYTFYLKPVGWFGSWWWWMWTTNLLHCIFPVIMFFMTNNFSVPARLFIMYSYMYPSNKTNALSASSELFSAYFSIIILISILTVSTGKPSSCRLRYHHPHHHHHHHHSAWIYLTFSERGLQIFFIEIDNWPLLLSIRKTTVSFLFYDKNYFFH